MTVEGRRRTKGFALGLFMFAAGITTVLVATGVAGRACSNAIPCQAATDCEDGCAKGRPADCRQAGLIYLEGFGVERSVDRAHGLLRRACDANDAEGCTALGALVVEHFATLGVQQRDARAIFGKACDGGNAMGCNNLANMLDVDVDAGPDRDPARAWTLFLKACEHGSGMACSTVAKGFQAGDRVPRDPAQAARFFARSLEILQRDCDAGNPRACGQAGWLLERGLGGAKDVGKATRDYQSGCDSNDGASCYNLALARRTANGGDPAAAALLAKGCQLGLPEACRLAGAP